MAGRGMGDLVRFFFKGGILVALYFGLTVFHFLLNVRKVLKRSRGINNFKRS